MKKIKVYISFLCISILILLTSCAELIKTELIDVDVVIDKVYHRDDYYDYVYVGDNMGPYYGGFGNYRRRYNPEVNWVRVRYENVYETINSKTLYEKYKNSVGQTIKGTLKINTYDNGEVYKSILIDY